MTLQTIPGRAIELGSDTEGDLAYYDGSKWTRLAKGTAGQLLATNSGATAPVWVDEPAASLPAAGTDGNVLTSDGTSWASEAPSGGVAGALVSQQLFRTAGAGTWTKPANVTQIRVWVIGPGGSSGHGSFCTSRGGGGGGCAVSILDVTNVTTYPYVIGSCTVQGNGNQTVVSTSFNVTITAGAGGMSWSSAGGDGNCSTPAIGAGGTAAGGQINISGSAGDAGNAAGGPLGGSIGRGAPADPNPGGGGYTASGGGGAVFIEEYA
jgi:hypothetical protein